MTTLDPNSANGRAGGGGGMSRSPSGDSFNQRKSSFRKKGGGDDKEMSPWQKAQALARPKMDVAKALALLGFTSSRGLDSDSKQELSEALARQLEVLERKKQRASNRNMISADPMASEEKARNEVRMLHEAYQYLSMKYQDAAPKEEEDHCISALGAMGMGGGGGQSWRD